MSAKGGWSVRRQVEPELDLCYAIETLHESIWSAFGLGADGLKQCKSDDHEHQRQRMVGPEPLWHHLLTRLAADLSRES